MAAKSTLRNMTVCLTAVCLICAAILGVVYAVTFDPIEQANQKALQASLSKVLPEGSDIQTTPSTVEMNGAQYDCFECTKDGQTVGYAVKSTTIGFGGPLSIMVGVLSDGTVYNTSVLSHSETPGLGAKCTDDEKFLANWSLESRKANGKKLDVIKVRKDGGDVDAITASTITSRAYSLAVSNAVEIVKSLAKEEEGNE